MTLHVAGCSALKRHVHTNSILAVDSVSALIVASCKVCPKCLPNGRPA
jgi:hypothetical protein